jgi:uncharacterized protein DUF3788
VALSAFDDKARPPSPRTLGETLGRTSALWRALIDALQSAHGSLAEEWRFAGQAWGWSFRLNQPKRTLVYLTPCRGHFLAGFALGEKACAAAQTARLPARILAILDAAPRYAEGRGVRIPVRTRADVKAVLTLAALKAGRSR